MISWNPSAGDSERGGPLGLTALLAWPNLWRPKESCSIISSYGAVFRQNEYLNFNPPLQFLCVFKFWSMWCLNRLKTYSSWEISRRWASWEGWILAGDLLVGVFHLKSYITTLFTFWLPGWSRCAVLFIPWQIKGSDFEQNISFFLELFWSAVWL